MGDFETLKTKPEVIWQVYFEMLDALLAEERIPDEHSNQTQV